MIALSLTCRHWSAACAAAFAVLAIGPSPVAATPDAAARLARGEAVVQISPADSPADGEIAAVIDILATPDRVWSVLFDCAGAPSFMDNLKQCRVVDQDPAGAWDVREHLVQWTSFLPQVRSVFRSDYVLNTSIRFKRVEGDLAFLAGEWRLEPMAGGAKTRLRYNARVGFHALVPAFMVRDALEADIPQFLGKIRDEVMRTAAG